MITLLYISTKAILAYTMYKSVENKVYYYYYYYYYHYLDVIINEAGRGSAFCIVNKDLYKQNMLELVQHSLTYEEMPQCGF